MAILDNINWITEAIDTVFSLNGKLARWLNIKGMRVCFILWSVNCIYWAFRDFQIGFYSQGIFCLISFGVNIYGFWLWKRKKFG